MSKPATETRSVVVEREIPYPPEKIWRALTQPHLLEEWLMKNDFKPAVGHRFNLRGDWGGVLDCEVLAVDPNKHGDPLAHGAVRLRAGSEAGLRGRQGGVAAVLGEAGAGLGAGRLKSAAFALGLVFRGSHIGLE